LFLAENTQAIRPTLIKVSSAQGELGRGEQGVGAGATIPVRTVNIANIGVDIRQQKFLTGGHQMHYLFYE
jgi:hypothetical protein